jgi:hypothetical protein
MNIPSDENCTGICVEVTGNMCLLLSETIIVYLMCLAISAGLGVTAIEAIEDC